MASKWTELRGLRAALKRNSLRHIDVATALGIHRETVTRWVNLDLTPGADSLMRLVEFLRRHEPTLEAADLFKGAR